MTRSLVLTADDAGTDPDADREIAALLAGSSLTAVGVLTDRDIVIAVVAGGADAKTLRVGDVMTESPVTVRESISVAATLQAMRRIGVRRMPVVDAFGRLQGVVSLDDIIETLAGELGDVAESIRNERRVEGALRR